MSCSSVDLKAYFLGEMARPETAELENHVAACDSCREEMDRLRLTQTALMSLPDEEVPRRIAFVSDRVFEPKWWQAFLRPGPVMGFASALLIAGAILAHGAMRPATVVVAAAPVVDSAQVEQQVKTAVAKAVADVEKREAARTVQMMAAAEKRFEFQHRADLVALKETIKLYDAQYARMMVAANYDRSRP